jgi:hypothetical protein
MRLVRALVAGAVVLTLGGAAVAQENLEQGKTGAQLYASDCAVCHKSAQALIKEGYPTEAFLRVHYTSGREMAGALFTYLRGVARADAAASASKKGKQGKSAEKKGEPKSASEKKPRREKKTSPKATGAKAGEAGASEKKEQPAEKKE